MITKDMTIKEIISKYPTSAVIMMKHGLHCVGCHVASFESLEQGAKAHGMEKKQIDEMVDEINKLLEKEGVKNGKTSD
ncbi:MAG: DUF1858 domain-containing protein [bacterium]|nr:DUF1858 domain-containing protein [bacterium]